MATILISGGTGLIGKVLSRKLMERNYTVAILSRKNEATANIKTYKWNIERREIEAEAIETADYIIHLAGENIGDKRWTIKRQQQILDSRIKTAELIFEKVRESNHKPKAFISASAIGYYGAITSDKIFMETAPPANDFLGNVCEQWEQAADKFEQLGIRTVKIRTGIVLTKDGGALQKMVMPVKMGIGSALGSGNQYMPWIHIDDLCAIYIKALEDEQMNGAYNAVAPDYKTNREFIKTLARILKKPCWFPPVPAFAMKIIFGKMSEMILKGSRVSADKIMAAGYTFLFPGLESALYDLLKS